MEQVAQPEGGWPRCTDAGNVEGGQPVSCGEPVAESLQAAGLAWLVLAGVLCCQGHNLEDVTEGSVLSDARSVSSDA